MSVGANAVVHKKLGKDNKTANTIAKGEDTGGSRAGGRNKNAKAMTSVPKRGSAFPNWPIVEPEPTT